MKPISTIQPDPQGAAAIDAQNRHLVQEAGLDIDLESQVPPRYDRFTIVILAVILVVSLCMLGWIIV